MGGGTGSHNEPFAELDSEVSRSQTGFFIKRTLVMCMPGSRRPRSGQNVKWAGPGRAEPGWQPLCAARLSTRRGEMLPMGSRSKTCAAIQNAWQWPLALSGAYGLFGKWCGSVSGLPEVQTKEGIFSRDLALTLSVSDKI
jgi:hypothetical protein